MADPATALHDGLPHEVLQLLWTLSLPNAQVRVSPELARPQHGVITHGHRSRGHTRGAPKIESIPSQRMSEVATAWDTLMKRNRPFHRNPHETSPHFLDRSVVLYGSRSDLAIQFTLGDLQGVLPASLCVLDVGAGPATATLGLFEFLRKLAHACRAATVHVPIMDVRVWSLDRSPAVLDYAERALPCYADTLSAAPNDPALHDSALDQYTFLSHPV